MLNKCKRSTIKNKIELSCSELLRDYFSFRNDNSGFALRFRLCRIKKFPLDISKDY